MQPSKPDRETDCSIPIQFTIRELLLATLLVAAAMSVIRTFGPLFAPCVFGLAAAGVGHWLTVRLKRRRVHDLMVSYFLGVLAGALAFHRQWPPRMIIDDLPSPVWEWMLPGIVIVATMVGVAGFWWFHGLNWPRGNELRLTVGGMTELRLARMFRIRREILVLGAVLIGLIGLTCAGNYVEETFDSSLGQALLVVFTAAACMASLGMLVNFAMICYYVFRIGLTERGFAYALGHTLICVMLIPIGIVPGVLLVPLLIRGDIERWHRMEDASR